jgi:hypothetical protein
VQVKKVHGLHEELHYGNDRLVSSVSKYNLMRQIEICKRQPNLSDVTSFFVKSGASLLGQCRSGSGCRVLMTKNYKILQLKIFFYIGLP